MSQPRHQHQDVAACGYTLLLRARGLVWAGGGRARPRPLHLPAAEPRPRPHLPDLAPLRHGGAAGPRPLPAEGRLLPLRLPGGSAGGGSEQAGAAQPPAPPPPVRLPEFLHTLPPPPPTSPSSPSSIPNIRRVLSETFTPTQPETKTVRAAAPARQFGFSI